MQQAADAVLERIAPIYRQEPRGVFAIVVRLLADMGLAEEGVHNAVNAAVRHWPCGGEDGN